MLASSMDEIQHNIFSMGFGPMPFYQRCSVAVEYDEEHTLVRRVSCIMPHRFNVNGCKHSQHQDCYFCPYNPFYELLVDSAKPTVRCSPTHVSQQ
jgi:hypothetical protein